MSEECTLLTCELKPRCVLSQFASHAVEEGLADAKPRGGLTLPMTRAVVDADGVALRRGRVAQAEPSVWRRTGDRLRDGGGEGGVNREEYL